MRKLILQFGTVFTLLAVSATSLVAQDEESLIALIAPKGSKVENPRVCVSTTQTQIDKCPTSVLEQSCPSGNCDKNYTACRIYGPMPNNEYEYEYSEVETHEIENPKEEAINANGVEVTEDGTEVCHKRKKCICDDIPGVSATCKTDEKEEEVVIKKWKKTDKVCLKVKRMDPDEVAFP